MEDRSYRRMRTLVTQMAHSRQDRTRADIHDGSEHNTLQSEAGYIDARPHVRQIDETFLQRTAGPYTRITALHHCCPLLSCYRQAISSS
jgi:hypothetical protein